MNRLDQIITKEIKNVLILMPDKHLGNLLISLPAIKALESYFRGKRICLVIDSAYSELIANISSADKIIHYPRRQIGERNSLMRPLLFLRFIKALRNVTPHIAIDLEGRHDSALMAFLSGAKLRVGSSKVERAYLYNIKVPTPTNGHKVFYYTSIAESIGAKCDSLLYSLRSTEHWRSSLDKILKDSGLEVGSPIVSIHPGAGKDYKKWTIEGFASIADWLLSEGYQVIFVGSGKDIETIKQIKGLQKGKSLDLSGRLTLGELIALFERSFCFIGNDSGPMHLADSVGIPIIALFGPVDERRWGPLSERSVVLRAKEFCKGCKRKTCDFGYVCIKEISPHEVKLAFKRLIPLIQKQGITNN